MGVERPPTSAQKCGRVEGTGDEVSFWLEATPCEGYRKAGSATRACSCSSGLGGGISGGLCYMGHQSPWLPSLAQKKKKRKNWCAEWGNKGGFCNMRNPPSTLLSTAWASSEGSLNSLLPNIWKITASLWCIHNALVRGLIQEDNQIIEMGIYFFTLLLIQLDSVIRGRSPHVVVVSGWCMAGVDHRRGRSAPPALVWSPLLPAVLQEPVTHAAHITQITRTAVPAPISHVIFETSNILSLLINTVIMACQGFMLFLK